MEEILVVLLLVVTVFVGYSEIKHLLLEDTIGCYEVIFWLLKDI